VSVTHATQTLAAPVPQWVRVLPPSVAQSVSLVQVATQLLFEQV
jgi:hypothetical protein